MAAWSEWHTGRVYSTYQNDGQVYKTHYTGYVNGNVAIWYNVARGKKWNLVHHPSGYHIGAFRRLGDAKAAVATLRREFDLSILDAYHNNRECDMNVILALKSRVKKMEIRSRDRSKRA